MSQRCEPGCEGCACHVSPPCSHCTEHTCVCGDPNCDESKCDHDHIDALTEKCQYLHGKVKELEKKLSDKDKQLADKEKQLLDATNQKPPSRSCCIRDCPEYDNIFWKQETHMLRGKLAEMNSIVSKHMSLCLELEAERDAALLAQRRPWWRFWK